MINLKIGQNLKRLRDKIYIKQKLALEQIYLKETEGKKETENIKKAKNEIFILEQVFDSWFNLYNDDSNEFWGPNTKIYYS